MAEEQVQQAASEKRHGGVPLSSILVVASVVLAAAVYFIFFRSTPSEEEAQAAGEKKQEEEFVYGGMETLVINPKDAQFKRFLSIKVEFRVSDWRIVEEMGNDPLYKTQISDALIELLSDKTVEQLEAPTAKQDLKKEIMERLNPMLGPKLIKEKELVSEVIQDVYFAQYLIQ